jgi:uncharacterized membrane protein HdeD (DUF308 family)
MSHINPYEAPKTTSTVPTPLSPEESRVARNIRAICILYVVFGAIAILGGIGMVSDPKGMEVPPAVGWAVLVGGAIGLISAIGVLRKSPWGVPVCQIVSAVYLFGFPIGTILGGYFLLHIGQVKRAFRTPRSDS